MMPEARIISVAIALIPGFTPPPHLRRLAQDARHGHVAEQGMALERRIHRVAERRQGRMAILRGLDLY